MVTCIFFQLLCIIPMAIPLCSSSCYGILDEDSVHQKSMRIIHPEVGSCVSWHSEGPEMFTVPGTAQSVATRLGIWSLWRIRPITDLVAEDGEHHMFCQLNHIHSGNYLRFTNLGETVAVDSRGGPESILRCFQPLKLLHIFLSIQ